MQYRPAAISDREAIKSILTCSFDRIYARFARRSLGSLRRALVAADGAKLAGFVNWRIFKTKKGKIGYVFWLAVHPDYRRLGVGERLVREAVGSIGAEIGRADIYATVEEDNLPSRGLLEKAGFTGRSREAMRREFGRGRFRLYARMLFMPWEVLYCKRGGAP